MTRSEILEILKKYKNDNAEKYGINNLGLFGSYSKDEGRAESDIDIIIETKEPDFFIIIHIKDELMTRSMMLLFILNLVSTSAFSVIYVAPDGSDTNPGTWE